MPDRTPSYPMTRRVHRRAALLDRMLEALDLSEGVAARLDGGAGYYEACSRCIACLHARECRLALAGAAPLDLPLAACANRAFLLACRRSRHGGPAAHAGR